MMGVIMDYAGEKGGVAIIVCITVLIILFAGEPDIHDAIIKFLMGG